MRSSFSTSSLNLGRREVHVWRIPLDATSPDFWSLLSEDERRRALRFIFKRDQIRFVNARASMRSILARYLGIAPEVISLGFPLQP